MSLFNYNLFPILFFLIWNILYVKSFFNKKYDYSPSLYQILRLSKNSLWQDSLVFSGFSRDLYKSLSKNTEKKIQNDTDYDRTPPIGEFWTNKAIKKKTSTFDASNDTIPRWTVESDRQRLFLSPVHKKNFLSTLFFRQGDLEKYSKSSSSLFRGRSNSSRIGSFDMYPNKGVNWKENLLFSFPYFFKLPSTNSRNLFGRLLPIDEFQQNQGANPYDFSMRKGEEQPFDSFSRFPKNKVYPSEEKEIFPIPEKWGRGKIPAAPPKKRRGPNLRSGPRGSLLERTILPSFASKKRFPTGGALEILLQPEITINKFSDYIVKERPLNSFNTVSDIFRNSSFKVPVPANEGEKGISISTPYSSFFTWGQRERTSFWKLSSMGLTLGFNRSSPIGEALPEKWGIERNFSAFYCPSASSIQSEGRTSSKYKIYSLNQFRFGFSLVRNQKSSILASFQIRKKIKNNKEIILGRLKKTGKSKSILRAPIYDRGPSFSNFAFNRSIEWSDSTKIESPAERGGTKSLSGIAILLQCPRNDSPLFFSNPPFLATKNSEFEKNGRFSFLVPGKPNHRGPDWRSGPGRKKWPATQFTAGRGIGSFDESGPFFFPVDPSASRFSLRPKKKQIKRNIASKQGYKWINGNVSQNSINSIYYSNEIGIYSLANYFASSEFPKKTIYPLPHSSRKNKFIFSPSFFRFRDKQLKDLSSSFTSVDELQQNQGVNPKNYRNLSERLNSLYFYEGNNLMPLKFSDAFKFNFKNMNIFLGDRKPGNSILEKQRNEKMTTFKIAYTNLINSQDLFKYNTGPKALLTVSNFSDYYPRISKNNEISNSKPVVNNETNLTFDNQWFSSKIYDESYQYDNEPFTSLYGSNYNQEKHMIKTSPVDELLPKPRDEIFFPYKVNSSERRNGQSSFQKKRDGDESPINGQHFLRMLSLSSLLSSQQKIILEKQLMGNNFSFDLCIPNFGVKEGTAKKRNERKSHLMVPISDRGVLEKEYEWKDKFMDQQEFNFARSNFIKNRYGHFQKKKENEKVSSVSNAKVQKTLASGFFFSSFRKFSYEFTTEIPLVNSLLNVFPWERFFFKISDFSISKSSIEDRFKKIPKKPFQIIRDFQGKKIDNHGFENLLLSSDKKIPKIQIKSKKLKSIFADINKMNSISFLQYFAFPFKTYPVTQNCKLQQVETQFPIKTISETKINIPNEYGLILNNIGQNQGWDFIPSFFRKQTIGVPIFDRDLGEKNGRRPNSQRAVQLDHSMNLGHFFLPSLFPSIVSPLSLTSLKQNKQHINKKKVKELLKSELPKLSIYYQKPIVKKKKGKQKKQSISLKNYIKNLSSINNEYFQINQGTESSMGDLLFNNKFALIQPLIICTLISKSFFFYFFLKYLRAFFLILGTEYVTNLSKVFMNIKYSDGNLLSILQLYKEFNDQLNQQDTINQRVNNQINSLKMRPH